MIDQQLHMKINGSEYSVEPKLIEWTLLRYLREKLGLTGTKQGCDNEGTCGLCKVIINGKARNACTTKLSKLDGAVIETIESMALKQPHPLVQTVIQDGIFQCGFCAPSAVMSAKALLDQNSNPSTEEIQQAINGVLCRCVGTNRIDHSIQRAAAIIRGDEQSTWTDEDSADEYMLLEKLTGQLKYTDDLSFPGMLYAAAFRANIPHAHVKRLDTSRAETMPGIVRVLSSKDIPAAKTYGIIQQDQPVFCDESHDILYVGDPLALVVGETQEQVNAALEKIEVELEPLPVLGSIEQALAPGASALHPRLRDKFPDSPNILIHFNTSKGDIAAGFADADLILEDDYKVPFVEHAYMEVETGIGVLENGGVTIYAGSQGPTDDCHQIAQVMGLPEEKVHIHHVFMGGGFGGKEDISTQIHAALAAYLTGRPVKVHWSRQESIWTSYKRHSAQLHYKMGAKKDGTIVAADITIYADTGAYASSGEAVVFRMSAFACGPYVVPNVRVNAYAVHTNNPPCGAFRGYGSPQVAFAAETHLQKMIEKLHLDSFDVRYKNALDLGKATITGDILTTDIGAGLIACLDALKQELQLTSRPEILPDEKFGLGIAAAYKNVGLGSNIPDQSGAFVSLEKEGTILVRHGATDMGQGVNPLVATIAGRVFGVAPRYIRVHNGDTKVDPAGGMTTASRATFLSGNAVLHASQQLREMIWEAVSTEFLVPKQDLEIREGVFVNKKTGKRVISLKELANAGQDFSSKYIYDAPLTKPPEAHSDPFPTKIPSAPMHFAYDFGVQAAMVAVNPNTGKVRVLKIIAAHDVGSTIIKRNVIGQLEGAAIQGLGYALSEEFVVKDGVPQTTHLKDLGLLRFKEVPEIIAIPVENYHPKGPLGAKGMGELAITPTAPAVSNAIHDAIGVWVNSLPMTPTKILAELSKNKEN
ncbi:MAG: putative aldehyde oxidoreductase [Chloroflexi bacterium]|nr:MAG: putative aldehyde oxidoreductase [Chloroflexota bacterium]